MNLFKSDQLFEDAARSVENCEKLIERLRGYRVRCVVGIVGTTLIAVGFLVWNLIGEMRALNAELKPATPTPNAVLEKLDSQNYQLTYPPVPIEHIDFDPLESVRGILVGFFVAMLICMLVALLHHDACLKMLLLMRARNLSS